MNTETSALAPLTHYFTCHDLKSFCNLVKSLVFKTKIRELAHLSKLWAETVERYVIFPFFFFLNYQGYSWDRKNQTFTRVTQAGWTQLYLQHRRMHLEQWELSAVGTVFCAVHWGFQQSSMSFTTFKNAPPAPPPSSIQQGHVYQWSCLYNMCRDNS